VSNKIIKTTSKLLESVKWKWAGHVARANDNWADIITSWTPAGKRRIGKPETRWAEDIIALDRNRTTTAQDRTTRSAQRKAFVQH